MLAHDAATLSCLPLAVAKLIIELRVPLAAADAFVIKVLANSMFTLLRAPDFPPQVSLQLLKLGLEHLTHITGTLGHLEF